MELPVDQIVAEIKHELNPQVAYSNILRLGKQSLASSIWETFEKMNLERDIIKAQKWLQKELQLHPEAKGIYLGLDTLNMDDGEGTNVEIGFSNVCNPRELDMAWMYNCTAYGENHLIYGLYEVSLTLIDEEKWTNEELSFTEYTIFLGYSGIVLREALLKIKHPQDFLSVWGFHDGDIFYLIQSIDQEKRILSDLPI